MDKNFPHKSIITVTKNFSCLVLSWLDYKFDLTQRSFFLYSALKQLSKTKSSLEWQKEGILTHIKVVKLKINWSMKHKKIDIKEFVFQQYILAQSWHERHKNRGKYIINTSVLLSLSINTITQTQCTKMLLLLLCCWV